METDHLFFLLFSQQPEWLRDLTGLPIPKGCRASAPIFKQTEVRCDLLLEPEDPGEFHYLIEFQLYHDHSIFNRIELGRHLLWRRLNGKADCRKKTYVPSEVEAVIIFGNEGDLPSTSDRYPGISMLFLDEMLRKLLERKPDSPLAAALSPLLEDAKNLEKDARRHYSAITHSRELSEDDREILGEIFLSLLLQKFKSKTYEEIKTMITKLIPLKETRAGADLYEEGEKRGMEKGMEKVISLMHAKGMSVDEIADLLDTSAEKIEKILSRNESD